MSEELKELIRDDIKEALEEMRASVHLLGNELDTFKKYIDNLIVKIFSAEEKGSAGQTAGEKALGQDVEPLRIRKEEVQPVIDEKRARWEFSAKDSKPAETEPQSTKNGMEIHVDTWEDYIKEGESESKSYLVKDLSAHIYAFLPKKLVKTCRELPDGQGWIFEYHSWASGSKYMPKWRTITND